MVIRAALLPISSSLLLHVGRDGHCGQRSSAMPAAVICPARRGARSVACFRFRSGSHGASQSSQAPAQQVLLPARHGAHSPAMEEGGMPFPGCEKNTASRLSHYCRGVARRSRNVECAVPGSAMLYAICAVCRHRHSFAYRQVHVNAVRYARCRTREHQPFIHARRPCTVTSAIRVYR